jgi:hypothetical protein
MTTTTRFWGSWLRATPSSWRSVSPLPALANLTACHDVCAQVLDEGHDDVTPAAVAAYGRLDIPSNAPAPA